MKKIIHCLALTLYVSSVAAQMPYYDAIELNKYLKPSGSNFKFQALSADDKDGFIRVFKNYVIESEREKIKNSKDLFEYFNKHDNEFLTPFLNEGGSTSDDSDPDVPTSKSFNFSSIGGLNVTSLADGLAKFLVSRTKQELSITFFDKFKNELETVPELKLLFPNSKKVLDAIGTEIYMYSNYLNSLREAFKKDLDNILVSLDNYIVQQHSDKPNITEPFSAGLYYTNQIKNGIHPAQAASNLSKRKSDIEKGYKSKDFRKFIYALKVFDIFSQSLKSRNSEKYWITSDSLNLLLDKNTLQIYAGLLYQKHKDERLGDTDNQTFGYFLLTLKDNLDKLKEPIQLFVSKSEELQNSIKSIKNKKLDGDKINSYIEVFSNSTKLIGEGKVLTEALNIPINSDSLNKYLYVANLISEIYIDINEAKYNALVLDLVSLSDTLNFAEKVFRKKIFKYGSFVANVAQAENSDQVQAAIEAIALPVGSASIKRKSQSNIALNAYLGLSPGREYLKETDEFKTTFGVNTPIGLAFSWGHYKKKTNCNCFKEKGSSSIFISLIDITAFSVFRFDDSETDELPEVQLSNIFAPGLYYVRGLPKVPISLGLGGQIGPQLRKITATEAETTSGLNASIRFFLAVDIPLINFYTKSR